MLSRITGYSYFVSRQCAGKEHTIQNTLFATDSNITGQFYHKEGGTATAPQEKAGIFLRRIGNTMYRVGVHFSQTSRETVNEKIARLIQNETAKGKAAGL